MPEDTTHRWIVLVQKAPQGPYSAAEIQSLLRQGALRRNDVAFMCSGDGRERLSDWRLLWQFPEFDRRNQPKTAAPTPPPSAPGSPEPIRYNRRRDMTPEEIAKAKADQIPADMMEIQPEELLFHGRASVGAPSVDGEPERIAEPQSRSVSSDAGEEGSGWGKWVIAAGVAMAALLIYPFFESIDAPQSPSEGRQGNYENPVRVPSARRDRSAPSRLPLTGARPQPSLPQPPEYTPQDSNEPEPFDFGEMNPNAYDEFPQDGEPFDEADMDAALTPGMPPRVAPPNGRALRPRPPASKNQDERYEDNVPPDAENYPEPEYDYEPPPPEEY